MLERSNRCAKAPTQATIYSIRLNISFLFIALNLLTSYYIIAKLQRILGIALKSVEKRWSPNDIETPSFDFQERGEVSGGRGGG